MKTFILFFLASCLALAANAQEIFFTAAGGEVWKANQDGSGSPALLWDVGDLFGANATGIQAIRANNILYFGGGNEHYMMAASLDGTGTVTVLNATDDGDFDPNNNAPGNERFDPAVDLAGSRLFYSYDNTGISVANLDGSGSSTEIYNSSDGLDQPWGLVYDDANDRIYFADRGNDLIGYGAGDGSQPLVILFDSGDGVSEPRNIAIDFSNGKIYWTELFNGAVKAGNLDGSGSPVTLYTVDNLAFGIDIDVSAGKIYFTEFEGGEGGFTEGVMAGNSNIWVGDADGSGPKTLLYMLDLPGGIRDVDVGAEQSVVIPTMSQWALFLFGLVVFTVGIVGVYNVRRVVLGDGL